MESDARTKYNGLYINQADRDFVVIDLIRKTDEIFEELIALLNTLEKIENLVK